MVGFGILFLVALLFLLFIMAGS